ncbi:MAG: ceramidase domain-containing protein [bacterium]
MKGARLNALMTQHTRLLVITTITLAVIVVLLALPPIPQSQAYHSFVDQRTLLGISNFLNVISNAPFFLVGTLGLFFLWQKRATDAGGAFVKSSEQWPYGVFFCGVVLTGFGSVYYHLAPDNARLFWDRLPMTLVFMSFFAAILTERISVKAGLLSLLPLVSFGIGTVIYWHWSELRGVGDLRLYIMVQFYPILAIPLIVLLFPSKYTRSTDLLGVFALYAVAKGFELLDTKIFALGRIVSGHTLKHLAAAFATYWILQMLRNRHPLTTKLRSASAS